MSHVDILKTFNKSTQEDDIAIVYFSSNFTLSSEGSADSASALKLPSVNQSSFSSKCTVTGWGPHSNGTSEYDDTNMMEQFELEPSSIDVCSTRTVLCRE